MTRREHHVFRDGTIVVSIDGSMVSVIVTDLPATWVVSDSEQYDERPSSILGHAVDALRDARREASRAEQVPHHRTCARCGTDYLARAAHARFCSARCRVAAHRQAHSRPPAPGS